MTQTVRLFCARFQALLDATDAQPTLKDTVRVGRELVRDELFADAADVFDYAASHWPDDPAGLLGLARLASSDGRRRLALDTWRRLIVRFPDQASAKWLFERGRAELAIGNIDEADFLFAGLRYRFPREPLGWLGAIRTAIRCKDDQAAAYWTAELTRRGWDATPENDAIERARRIERIDGGGAAWRDLLRLDEADRSMKVDLEELRLRRVSMIAAGDMAGLRSAADRVLARWPQRLTVLVEAAQAKICCRDDDVRSLIDDHAADIAEHHHGAGLLAWRAARGGDTALARSWWAHGLEQTYTASIDAICANLTPVGAAAQRSGGDLALITVVKDEMILLPAFFAHYRALGVDRFIVVDNGSTDGSFAWLQEQPDVALWRCPSGFRAAQGGMRWVNFLRAQTTQRWMIYVDVDEFIVLPAATPGVHDFVAMLDAHAFDAAAGFMLDMHPARWADLRDFRSGDDPLAACAYFTADYFPVGDSRSPWFDVVGGIRAHRFGTTETLRKVPFLRVEPGADYLDSHSTTPVRTAINAFALPHFKMIKEVLALDRTMDDARLDERSSASQTRHLKIADMLKDTQFDALGGTRFDGWRSIADSGLFAALSPGSFHAGGWYTIERAGSADGPDRRVPLAPPPAITPDPFARGAADAPVPGRDIDVVFAAVDTALRAALDERVAGNGKSLDDHGSHYRDLHARGDRLLRPRDSKITTLLLRQLPFFETIVVFRAGIGALPLCLAAAGRKVVALESSAARIATIRRATAILDNEFGGIADHIAAAPAGGVGKSPVGGSRILVLVGVGKADDVAELVAGGYDAIIFEDADDPSIRQSIENVDFNYFEKLSDSLRLACRDRRLGVAGFGNISAPGILSGGAR